MRAEQSAASNETPWLQDEWLNRVTAFPRPAGDHNRTMKVIADLCVVPIGIGVSVSQEVAICERILAAAGLKTHLHAYGTNIEGDWDRVFAAVKQCHEALHAAGVPRISTSMRFGTRTDRDQTMEDKVRSVEEKLVPSP
jgi:uncharacterized protein (TIGR00106 family)